MADTSASITAEQKLHVLHVVRKGQATGGMENGIVNVANRLPENFKVSICALDKEETFSQRIKRSDSQYFLLPKMGGGIDWSLVGRLAKVIRESGTHVVHSHNWGTFIYAVLAARKAGVPIIHGEHGKNPDEVRSEPFAKRITKRLLGKRVDVLATVSQSLAQEWEKQYGIPRGKIRSISNGVDTERFHPVSDKAAARRDFGIPENAYAIGSVGRLDELKNFGVLIEGFAKMCQTHADCWLALIGDGPLKNYLQHKAAALGVRERVLFLGHHSRPEVFLAALDVFALPSKYEGMSNVLLEAMASGLAIVLNDLPTHHQVVTPDVEAKLLNPCTPEAIAEALSALADPATREKLGSAARNKAVSTFGLRTMAEEYERLYLQNAPRMGGKPDQR